MHFIVELFANNLGQEILLDVTNPTIVSYIKIVGFGLLVRVVLLVKWFFIR